MATTAIPYTNLVGNAGLTRPAGTTLVAAPTNDMQISDAVAEETVIDVNNSGGASINITIKAGDNPPGLAAGQGDLVVAVAASAVAYIGPFESGRFIQSDGSIMVESSATTGAIRALRVPRNA